MRQSTQSLSGMAYAVGAYMLWGVLPVYWKMLNFVEAHEILAHRIIWSFAFMVLLVIYQKRQFFRELREVLASRKKMAGVFLAAVLISINWFIFIWAVNAGRIVETSLGYYINPLLNVLLGIIVLKEKLSLWQGVSVFMAGLGVFYMTVHFGSIPWVSLSLALSFGLYGLCKKMVNISGMTSVTLETMLCAPAAAAYVIYLEKLGAGVYANGFTSNVWLLIGGGVVTAIPLLLFAMSASRLPLSMLGFIQYFAPTISLFLGVFLYNEPFTHVHAASFSLIWLGLVIFSVAKTPFLIKIEENMRKRVLFE